MSRENGDPPEMGTPGPHSPGRMGTRVPNLQGEWGPGSPIYRENGDPGSPFSQENGDPLVRMGTPQIKERGIKSYLRDEDGEPAYA